VLRVVASLLQTDEVPNASNANANTNASNASATANSAAAAKNASTGAADDSMNAGSTHQNDGAPDSGDHGLVCLPLALRLIACVSRWVPTRVCAHKLTVLHALAVAFARIELRKVRTCFACLLVCRVSLGMTVSLFP
jgi:hypothetical protein